MAELSAIVLQLRPMHADSVPAGLGYAGQGWFLESLGQIQPEVATIVHDGNGAKPFTVSALRGVKPTTGELLHLSPAQTYTLRVTTLAPDLTRLTLNTLVERWLTEGVRLHDQPFHVERIIIDREANPWAGTDDYAGLLERYTVKPSRSRQAMRRLSFNFAAPTSFKKTVKPSDDAPEHKVESQQLPLPLPDLVFGSLITRWSAMSTIALHPDLARFVNECVVISQHRIQTRYVSFERSARGGTVGFVGDVTFNVLSGDSYWLGLLNMLAAFAVYSGVGVRTTMGLGQVRARLEAPEPVAEKE
ncbi:MAG: CRISPR system precrRNA processing endoribonuclease RAMP protein Cas6 [Aggregatilineales bacterium]